MLRRWQFVSVVVGEVTCPRLRRQAITFTGPSAQIGAFAALAAERPEAVAAGIHAATAATRAADDAYFFVGAS